MWMHAARNWSGCWPRPRPGSAQVSSQHGEDLPTYRYRVGQLIRGLSEPEGAEEAKEALRALVALVEKIVLVPEADEDNGTRLAIDLHGALASLLCLATGRPVHKRGWVPRKCDLSPLSSSSLK